MAYLLYSQKIRTIRDPNVVYAQKLSHLLCNTRQYMFGSKYKVIQLTIRTIINIG